MLLKLYFFSQNKAKNFLKRDTSFLNVIYLILEGKWRAKALFKRFSRPFAIENERRHVFFNIFEEASYKWIFSMLWLIYMEARNLTMIDSRRYLKHHH